MAPIKVKRAANNPCSEERRPSSVPTESIDASKLNDLMSNLDKRLAGGLQGEYFEEGGRLDNKHRHRQLETVFGLRKELADIKTQMDKREQQAVEAEQTKAVGKGSAPAASKNMIATIKTVVQQELSEKLRDLSLRNERLEVGVKKADERIETLGSKIKTLEVKLKKAEERNQKLNDKFSDCHVRALEEHVKNAALQIKIAGLERQNWSLEQQVQRLEEPESETDGMNPLQCTMTNLRWDFHGCTERLEELEKWRNQSRNEDYGYGAEGGEDGDADEDGHENGAYGERDHEYEDGDEDDGSISSGSYGLGLLEAL